MFEGGWSAGSSIGVLAENCWTRLHRCASRTQEGYSRQRARLALHFPGEAPSLSEKLCFMLNAGWGFGGLGWQRMA